MEFFIFSDSHGRIDPMRIALARDRQAQHILFLGDGLDDLAALQSLCPGLQCCAVRGNCDDPYRHRTEELTLLLSLYGHKILMGHGHTWGVKSGIETAVAQARAAGAEVLLFGHTHQPLYTYKDGLHICNPGSIGHPPDGRPSFARLTLTPSTILLSHGNV